MLSNLVTETYQKHLQMTTMNTHFGSNDFFFLIIACFIDKSIIKIIIQGQFAPWLQYHRCNLKFLQSNFINDTHNGLSSWNMSS